MYLVESVEYKITIDRREFNQRPFRGKNRFSVREQSFLTLVVPTVVIDWQIPVVADDYAVDYLLGERSTSRPLFTFCLFSAVEVIVVAIRAAKSMELQT